MSEGLHIQADSSRFAGLEHNGKRTLSEVGEYFGGDRTTDSLLRMGILVQNAMGNWLSYRFSGI